MKNRSYLLVLLSLAALAFFSGHASAQKKTIILVRHAEKSATGSPADMAKGDPELSPEGRERAERFARAAKKYRPQEIFSTDFKRTRQTAEPLAKIRKKDVQTYDPAKQPDFAEKILSGKTERFVIVGHSNTTPALANLLIKKEVFKQLPDPEYGVFWVIRIKKGVVKRVEVYPY